MKLVGWKEKLGCVMCSWPVSAKSPTVAVFVASAAQFGRDVHPSKNNDAWGEIQIFFFKYKNLHTFCKDTSADSCFRRHPTNQLAQALFSTQSIEWNSLAYRKLLQLLIYLFFLSEAEFVLCSRGELILAAESLLIPFDYSSTFDDYWSTKV